MRRWFAVALITLSSACARVPTPPPTFPPPPPLEVQILAINDFHGNLEPPGLSYTGAHGTVPVGGAAYLATALKAVRTAVSITVAAGDLISASPLVSSLYYDEPTIEAMSDSGLALASVGNHEFDRGPAELLRMQRGGCRAAMPGDTRQSCKLEQFKGASFEYLAANVVDANGKTLFPATALRDIGGVRIGFIGMTLRQTATMVSPDGVKGLTFTDEADTANALVPQLQAAGAKAIVLLIHQGGSITGDYDDQSCPGLSGDILPILARLDPAIRLVVSGHTHNAYICHLPLPGGGERLLTSAGKYGGLVTDIRLGFGRDGTLGGESAQFVPVQGEPITKGTKPVAINPAYRQFPPDPAIAALVQRYHDAAQAIASRPVGKLPGELVASDSGVSVAAEFIADGEYFAARPAAKGGSDFALMNDGGARSGIIPAADGTVAYGQIFTMQPFSNNIVTLSLTGADVLALLEQQFDSGLNTVDKPNLLMPSANVRMAYDRSRPAGARVVSVTIDGKPLDRARTYRVTVNNFMASGGDNFTLLARGIDRVDAGLDLDATEAYLRTNPPLPAGDRVIDRTPKDWAPPKS
jgi:5'-nucleotidase